MCNIVYITKTQCVAKFSPSPAPHLYTKRYFALHTNVYKIFYTFVASNFTDMNRRLQQLLELESLTQAQFAERIGVGRASISHILNGRNKPGYDIIQSILKAFPKLSPDWLLLGKGKPYRDDTRPFSTLFPAANERSYAEAEQSVDSVFQDESTDREPVTDIFSLEQPADNPVNGTDTGTTRAIQEQSKGKESRRIRRITIYYDDNTFEEFFR